MTTPDPDGSRRLTIAEARTLRRWTVGLLLASTIVILASSFTDPATDRIIAALACATLLTGAAVVRRPLGMRVILAICGLAMGFMAVTSTGL